jgi:spore germination protein
VPNAAGVRRLAVGVAVVLAAGTLSAAPGAASAAPVAAADPVRRVASGWITHWRLDDGVASVLAHPELFRDVSVFWFRATKASTVVEQEPGAQPPETDLVSAVQALQAQGVAVHLTVNDAGFNATRMASLLRDRARRALLVSNLVATAQRVGADGIDVDFEAMNFGSVGADRTAVKRLFPVFLARLRDRLHAVGLRLAVALPPRTGARDPAWEVFDYRAIAPTVDRARVMAYDYHVPTGSAGPVAPTSWVADVARFTGAGFGRRASLGMPAYGYNWPVTVLSGTCPTSAPGPTTGTTRAFADLAASYSVTPRFVPSTAAYTYTYRRTFSDGTDSCRVKREVWYEDSRSVKAKLPLLSRYGLASVALWELGGERPGTWRVLLGYA